MKIIILELIINLLLKLSSLKKFKKNKNIIINNDKGKYLTTMGNCISCHTVEGGAPYGGGYSMKTEFGIINSPNITYDKINGIGKIKLKNFIKFMREGVSKNGEFITPAFPYKNFSRIKKSDLKEIFLFLKKIKKQKLVNKKNKLIFPIQYKKLMIFSRIIFFKKKKYINKKIKSNIKRGKYITNSLGHCNMCHTKINRIGEINKFFKYKGINFLDNWESKELNNNNKIKNLKTKEIYKTIKFGISKGKTIGGSMVNIINKSLQYLNRVDLESISKYVKNIINKKKILKINKINNKIFENIKKKIIIYKKECKNCHGKLNLGNYPIFPKLIKIQEVNSKNIKSTLKINENLNTLKNKYPSIMKNFKNINLLSIKNYIKIIKELKKK